MAHSNINKFIILTRITIDLTSELGHKTTFLVKIKKKHDKYKFTTIKSHFLNLMFIIHR